MGQSVDPHSDKFLSWNNKGKRESKKEEKGKTEKAKKETKKQRKREKLDIQQNWKSKM